MSEQAEKDMKSIVQNTNALTDNQKWYLLGRMDQMADEAIMKQTAAETEKKED